MQRDNLAGLVIENKYRLDHKIGEGGMGAVYRGTQLMVDRHVAIKLLHSGLSGHERIKQRFEVEAKAIGRMHHPNCITLFDFGFSPDLGAFYMVMEYLDGTPMNDLVGTNSVPWERAVDITRQVAMALDHAHHQKILHRDLKPENVMITTMTDGNLLVKVLDFGIARIFQDDEEQTPQEQNRLTKAGEVFGTPAYISPEQARGERNLEPSSDLYSLGVMLFEMLQGQLPFWGDTAIDTIMQHITAPVPPLHRIDIPNQLKQLVYQLLDKDPSARPQSGKELSEQLAQVLNIAAGVPASISGSMPRVDLSLEMPMPHMTMQNLSDNEIDEWSNAGATVVGSSPQYAPTPPAEASNSGFYAAPQPGQFGEEAFSTQEEIELDAGKKSWLVPVILVLLLLTAGAAVAAYVLMEQDTQAQKEQPASPDVPTISADTDAPPSPPVDPDNQTTTDPDPSDDPAAKPDVTRGAQDTPPPPDDPPVKPEKKKKKRPVKRKVKKMPKPAKLAPKSLPLNLNKSKKADPIVPKFD